MKEIEDENGTMIPISEVKCVHGGLQGKPRIVKPDSPYPDGPCFFTFETLDGKRHFSKEYQNMEDAYAGRRDFELHVDQLNTARRHGKKE